MPYPYYRFGDDFSLNGLSGLVVDDGTDNLDHYKEYVEMFTTQGYEGLSESGLVITDDAIKFVIALSITLGTGVVGNIQVSLLKDLSDFYTITIGREDDVDKHWYIAADSTVGDVVQTSRLADFAGNDGLMFCRITQTRSTNAFLAELSTDGVTWTTVLNTTLVVLNINILQIQIKINAAGTGTLTKARCYYINFLEPFSYFTSNTDLSAYNVSGYSAHIQLGAEGKAEIEVDNKDLATRTNLLNEIRTAIKIRTSYYGNVFFHGEITRPEFRKDKVVFELLPIASKLRKTRGVYSSNLKDTREILNIDTWKLNDNIGGFPTDNSWDNVLTLLVKQQYKTFTTHLTAISHETSWLSSTSYTPDNTYNTKLSTYFKEDQDTDSVENGYVSWDNLGVTTNYLTILEFDVYLITGTTILQATIDLESRTRPINTSILTPALLVYSTHPQIAVYNYNIGDWSTPNSQVNPSKYILNPKSGYEVGSLVDFSSSNGSGNKSSPVHVVQIDLSNVDPAISDSIADHYDNTSEAEVDGFITRHRFRVAFSHGAVDDIHTNDIQVFYAALNLVVDTNQISSSAHNKAVISSTTDKQIVFKQNAAVSWQDHDVPYQDAVFAGDLFHVVDDLETLFATLWTQDQSGASSALEDFITLSWQTNLGNANAIPRNVANEYVYNLIQEASRLLNASWYWRYITTNSPEDTIIIEDAFSSCGLVLTEADILPLTWREPIDTQNQRDNVVGVASGGITYSKTNTVEYTHSLGKETEIINLPNIKTVAELKDYIDNLATAFTSAERFFYLDLNFNNPKQDYSLLQVGETVGVTLTIGVTTIINYTAGNDGELLIYGMTLNRNASTGYRDIVTLMLQKRS